MPKDLKAAKVQPNEIKMAERLIDDMDDEVGPVEVPRHLPRRPPEDDRGEGRGPRAQGAAQGRAPRARRR